MFNTAIPHQRYSQIHKQTRTGTYQDFEALSNQIVPFGQSGLDELIYYKDLFAAYLNNNTHHNRGSSLHQLLATIQRFIKHAETQESAKLTEEWKHKCQKLANCLEFVLDCTQPIYVVGDNTLEQLALEQVRKAAELINT